MNGSAQASALISRWGEMCLEKGERGRGMRMLASAADTFKKIGAARYLQKAERVMGPASHA